MTLQLYQMDTGRKLSRERIFGRTRKRKIMKYLLLISVLLFGISLPAHSTKSAHQLQGGSEEPLSLTSDEIAKLVSECGERTTRMTGQLLNYSYIEIDSEYELDKRGQVTRERSKVYEVNPVRIGKVRYFSHVQIAEDGVAYSAEKVAGERERIVKELTQAEESAARGEDPKTWQNAEYKPKFSSYGIRVEKRRGMFKLHLFIGPTDFLTSHEFYAPRRIVFNDRETILLSFRPRPGYVFDKTTVRFPHGIEDYGRVMTELGGNIWIDAADKVIARLEAMPLAEMGDVRASAKGPVAANAPLGFEFTHLSNGTWVPSRSWYNSYGREKVFLKTAASRALRFSEFKLFKTSVEVEKLERVPQKP